MSKLIKLTEGEYSIRIDTNPPGFVGTTIIYLRNHTNDTEAIIPIFTTVPPKNTIEEVGNV